MEDFVRNWPIKKLRKIELIGCGGSSTETAFLNYNTAARNFKAIEECI